MTYLSIFMLKKKQINADVCELDMRYFQIHLLHSGLVIFSELKNSTTVAVMEQYMIQ